VNPWEKLVLGFNIIYPLNDQGLREDWLPTLSVEWLW
jgi:hypothetical protein